MNDPLAVLGLKPGDSFEKAKKRRNALCLQYHPDKRPGEFSATKKYREIQDAYEKIKSNPSLLNVSPCCLSGNSILKISVSIKDFYFENEKTIRFQRRIFCPDCKGLGTLSASGICDICDGTGKIESSVLGMMNRSPVCAGCKGSGVKPGKECPRCKAVHRKNICEEKEYTFKLNLDDFHRKSVSIPGIGNQVGNNQFGTVHVHLDISYEGPLSVEDDYFFLYRRVLPIQKIVGDEDYLEVFGRKVKYKIEKGSVDAYTEDRIGDGLRQLIRVKYIDTQPELTVETKKLYESILKIEKKNRGNGNKK